MRTLSGGYFSTSFISLALSLEEILLRKRKTMALVPQPMKMTTKRLHCLKSLAGACALFIFAATRQIVSLFVARPVFFSNLISCNLKQRDYFPSKALSTSSGCLRQFVFDTNA